KEPERKFFTPALILFWASMFFFYGSYNASSYILPLRLSELGFLNQDYSLARAIAVVVELVLLLLMPFLTKRLVNKKIALYIGFSFILIATASAGFLAEPWSLAYINLVLGHVGKAFLFAFQALWLVEIVGKKNLSKALTVNTGGINLMSAGMNLLSSTLHQAWGFQGYFGLLAGLEALGLVLLIPAKESAPSPMAAE
ncbi:MAG: MFS transporter, partial [Bacilli bacterium]|nr:MFS transporter [Bacilli bacterium]